MSNSEIDQVRGANHFPYQEIDHDIINQIGDRELRMINTLANGFVVGADGTENIIIEDLDVTPQSGFTLNSGLKGIFLLRKSATEAIVGIWRGERATSGDPYASKDIVFDAPDAQDRIDLIELDITEVEDVDFSQTVNELNPATKVVSAPTRNVRRVQLVEIYVKKGTPGGSPVAPAATAGRMAVKEVYIANGASEILAGDIVSTTYDPALSPWTTAHNTIFWPPVYDIYEKVGFLPNLTTDDQSSLVAAINEINRGIKHKFRVNEYPVNGTGDPITTGEAVMMAGPTIFPGSGIEDEDSFLYQANESVALPFGDGSTHGTKIIFNDDTTAVVVYFNSGSTFAVCLEVTEGKVTNVGTHVSLGVSGLSRSTLVKIAPNKYAVSKTDAGSFPQVIVFTVSGLTITAGIDYLVPAGSISDVNILEKLDDDKLAYIGRENSGAHYIVAATVSGTVVSFGTKVVFDNTENSPLQGLAVSIGTDKLFIAYRRAQVVAPQGVMRTVVCTFAGTVPSFGAIVNIGIGNDNEIDHMLPAGADRVIMSLYDITAGTYKLQGATVAGTVITLGAQVPMNPAGMTFSRLIQLDTDKFHLQYGWNTTQREQIFTMSGHVITLAANRLLYTAPLYLGTPSPLFNIQSSGSPTNRLYNTTARIPNSDEWLFIVVNGGLYYPAFARKAFLLGVAQEDGAVDTDIYVTIEGLSRGANSGLMAGSLVYADTDGSVVSDNSKKLLGRAVSDTDIHLKINGALL